LCRALSRTGGWTALAQILTGEINPSGKLPFSYIQKRSEASEFAGYKDPGLKVNYSEGVFVGYRYYDRNKIKPLFPFGYGLSYTTFKYDHLRIKKTGPAACEVVFDVKNTGPIAGAETAQIYVGPQHPPVPRPVRELKGFAKVQLAPGETKTVTIPLGDRAFEFFLIPRKINGPWRRNVRCVHRRLLPRPAFVAGCENSNRLGWNISASNWKVFKNPSRCWPKIRAMWMRP